MVARRMVSNSCEEKDSKWYRLREPKLDYLAVGQYLNYTAELLLQMQCTTVTQET